MFSELPVTITPKAWEEVKHIVEKKNIPEEYGLRIGIKGAGCSGMSFLLGFDKKQPTDMEFSQDGYPIYIAKKDTMYLLGLQVDFYEGADARGFTFVNPDVPSPEGVNS
ncbi:MAG TPA: iron-sulfur cluster assembly accessory protein [Cytophagales bacterium]|nr:iron-sulfur cluster assembly accessory protein [Cytophagales bacterium]HAA23554.1 iron-sulfur cluster assembly accessory protein [Cytophagales bacterium]HAP59562.1 iron-sulfur cluster assembly accessory protein [Cytophagales bacterium]